MRYKTLALKGACVAALLYGPYGVGVAASFAQEDETARLATVVVTAQKKTESLQNTPIAVSVASGEELQAGNITTTEELGAIAPGLIATNTIGGSNVANLNIRSIGGGDILSFVETRVGQYFDGIYYGSTFASASSFVELERVEVLRGPQGTLYGRNNTGGTINFITKKPLGDFRLKQDVTVANRGEFRTVTALDTPTFGDFSAKITFMHEEQEEFVGNASPTDPTAQLGAYDNEGLRAAIRWTPTDTFTADYTYDYGDRKSIPHPGQFHFVNAGSPFAGAAAAGFIDVSQKRLDTLAPAYATREQLDIEGHGLTLTLDTPIGEVKSISAYRKSDGTRLNVEVDGSPIRAFFTASDEFNALEQFSQEVNLNTELSDRLGLTTGIFYYDAEADSSEVLRLADTPTGPVDLTLAPPDFNTTARNQKSQSLAVYGQMTYTPPVLDDRIDVTLGLRWSEDKKDFAYSDPSIFLPGVYSYDSPLTINDSWGGVSPLLNVSFDWTNNINTYARWSKSYNSGGFNGRARGFLPGTTTPLAAVNFDEENLNAWEAGLKSELFDNRLRLNLASFYYDYKDQQVLGPITGSGAGASTTTVNAGKSEIWGAEAEFTALLTDRLTLSGNYAYLNAEFIEFAGLDGMGNIVNDAANRVVPDAPEHSGALSLLYAFDPFSFGNLSFRTSADYRSEVARTDLLSRVISNNATLDARTNVNARLTLSEIPIGSSGRSMKISLWGKNLTDDASRQWITDVPALGLTLASYGELRSYGVDFTIEFQ